MADLGFSNAVQIRLTLDIQPTDSPSVVVNKKYVDGIKSALDTFLAAIPTSNITQTASARFVTDDEKTAWNGKASTALATSSTNGLLSNTLFSKLSNITDFAAGGTMNGDLNVNGNVNVTGDVFYDLSDIRMKTEFESIDNVIDKIMKIDTGYYYYNNLAKTYGYIKEDRQIGVKAQQIKELFPEAVALAPFDNDNGFSRSGENYLTVRYEKLVPILIEAFKEQQKEINKLKLLVGDNNG